MGVDPLTGTYQFVDKDGKLTTNPDYLTDRTAFVNSSPEVLWRSYKHFSVQGY